MHIVQRAVHTVLRAPSGSRRPPSRPRLGPSGSALGLYQEKAAKANARQEDFKQQLKEATVKAEALTDDPYRTSSRDLDASIAP